MDECKSLSKHLLMLNQLVHGKLKTWGLILKIMGAITSSAYDSDFVFFVFFIVITIIIILWKKIYLCVSPGLLCFTDEPQAKV